MLSDGRSSHEAFRDGRWVPVTFERYYYGILNDNNQVHTFVKDYDVQDPMPIQFINIKSVECPALVFVYLPDDSTDTYNAVKMISHFFWGLQCSCAVAKKFESQRNPDQ